MTEYLTHVQFVSCTTLVDFQNNSSTHHKMNLAWNVPTTNQYKYDRIELYRYIGDYMGCVNPDNLNETTQGMGLIYVAKQNDIETTTITTYFPSTIITTLSENLTAINGFIDDFSSLNPIGVDLDSFHSLPGVNNNQTITDDIGFTRRTLYYILKTYIKGVTNSAPYLLTPDYKSTEFTNHSSKTQVRHNYLHYEGDEMWSAKEVGAGTSVGISRTAVDINRLFLDITQAGPTGRGGYAWVSDRDTGQIFQHNLKDGYRIKTWQMPYPHNQLARGFGICIEASTGDCIACPGDTQNNITPSVYRCNIRTGATTLLLNLLGQPYKKCGYGVIPLYGYPDRVLITDYSSSGYPTIYNITNNTAMYSLCGGTYGYAAASCPNSKGVQTGHGSNIVFISPTDAFWFSMTPGGGAIYKTGGTSQHRIGVDNYNTYPNTIINTNLESISAREYFSVWTEKEFGIYVPTNSTEESQCSTSWALQWKSDATSYLGASPNTGDTGGYIELTTGYDGENNAWILGSGTVNEVGKKTKLYRTAHNKLLDVNVDDSLIFPYGGNSRYYTSYLNQWSYSFVNDKDIEWFLTRNHGVSTLDVSGLFPSGQIKLDPSTLNDTISASWLEPDALYTGSPGLTATAYQAWWSMVEEKMLRKHYPSDGWSSSYFKVYDENGVLDGNARKWGIRMDVSDLRTSNITLSGIDNDLFYETKSAIWLPKILIKIKAWSDAFANSSTSYKLEANRNTLIANNIIGALVHPHYNKALLAVDNYYINDNLSTAQKSELTTYAVSVKYINLHNLITFNLYMYSDFTGNVLQGSLESSPLNKDIIHPIPTTPSLILSVSGYQSNPGYQDIPAYCYPWKNTLPILMSSRHNDISGYDDFNVSYLASANMGSYLLTSYSLSTDDFVSPYYTDLNNQAGISHTVNTSYNSSNIYDLTTTFDYTYHSPSMNGLYYIPSGKNDGTYEYPHCADGKSDGRFNAKIFTSVKDLYDYNTSTAECTIVTLSGVASVAVFERWPEPKFYIETYDNSTIRKNKFCRSTWDLSRFDKNASLRKESNATDAKRYDTIYGVDPISAVIQDRSIARTWPISSWSMNISTTNFRLTAWPTSGLYFQVLADSNVHAPQDTQNLFDVLSSMPFRYGDYALTMNVQASTTSTSSDKPFIQYIKVSEFEPFANFWAWLALTVPSNFIATNASITSNLIPIIVIPNGNVDVNSDTYYFVSGYAPNLTVYFQDSSEAHTFPISSYHWNFGDSFNEGPEDVTLINSNYYTVTTNSVTGNFNDDPVCWQTTVQAHTAVHTYIMPGTYDVTLTVRASCTSTSDTCARYIEDIDDSKKFYVYVEEILPQCGDGIYGSLLSTTGFTSASGGIDGGSPLTAYFMVSGIIAGSFPICRIDWDFGDGSIQRITRYPLTQTTTQGLSVINISAYSYDLEDPRNIVVPHIYINQTELDQTLNINISAYACNTNTLLHCQRNSLVSYLSAEINVPTSDTKKLIGSRFDDDGNLIYIIEGEKDNTTYTIALSGELNNG